MKARRPVALLLAVLLTALAGCGEDAAEDPAGAAGPEASQRLVVSAAASLTGAFERYAAAFEGAEVRLSFAGSDELAAQIRQGVKPDVYAAANTTLPDALAKEGLVERPVRFASNELVIAVPAGSGIGSLDDLAEPGVALVIGSESVPFGAYTRDVLARLDPALERAILANVRSEEPDVRGAVGKLTQGAADAAFAYNTDVTAGEGALEAIELDRRLRPKVAYAAAVVRGAQNPEGARAFIDGLRSGSGAEALRAEGFGPPLP